MSVVYLDFQPSLKRQTSELKRLCFCKDLTPRPPELSRDVESEFIDKTVLFKCFTLQLNDFKASEQSADRNLKGTNFRKYKTESTCPSMMTMR